MALFCFNYENHIQNNQHNGNVGSGLDCLRIHHCLGLHWECYCCYFGFQTQWGLVLFLGLVCLRLGLADY